MIMQPRSFKQCRSENISRRKFWWFKLQYYQIFVTFHMTDNMYHSLHPAKHCGTTAAALCFKLLMWQLPVFMFLHCLLVPQCDYDLQYTAITHVLLFITILISQFDGVWWYVRNMVLFQITVVQNLVTLT